jgi:FtsP/CotA-like multicopper oxidase with cupredoxin domain
MSPNVSSRSAPLAVQRFVLTLAVTAAFAACLSAPAFGQGDPLDASTLTKFVDPLPIPVPMATVAPNKYEIGAWPVVQKLHRDLPPTHLYGYGPTQGTATFPGMTIMATRGVPTLVHWTNHLPLPHLLDWAVDPTIGQALVTTGVPVSPHVHGGEQEPASDGGAFAWFTPNFAEKGPTWKHETFVYANRQQAATIWYHDHAFGYTRFNPYAGLAGFYILQDPTNEPKPLPSGKYDIPIVIQDKDVFPNGDLWYPTGGDNPWIHPVWVPEAFFNMIVVNGKAWPYLNVEQHAYRFRFLDGSNARFYSLALVNRATGAAGPAFVQIAGDGGYLPAPATLNQPNKNSSRLVIAPGERAEVVIDFAKYPVGTELLLTNTAFAPYPTGDAPDPNTTGQIMLFRVGPTTDNRQNPVPSALNKNGPKLSNPIRVRQLTLNETEGPNGPIGMFLNGHEMMDPATETPTLGTTEEWDIVNTTMDAHPIHLHLVQMQLLNRQAYNATAYMNVYEQANPVLPTANPVEVAVGPYLVGATRKADPNETGWKDTFRMNPGEVTRLLIRFGPQDNTFGSSFAFDATASPGYLWHCHILEHEENDMMRPLLMQAPGAPTPGPCAATTPVTDENGLANSPKSVELRAAPNPVRTVATLSFTLPTAAHVELRIFDVTGREVGVLADGTYEAGIHPVTWNARDTQGRSLASGIYFARLRAQNVDKVQRLVVAP